MDSIPESPGKLQGIMRLLRLAQINLPAPSVAWRRDALATAQGQVREALNRLTPYVGTRGVQHLLSESLRLLEEALPPRGSLTIDDSIISKREEAVKKLRLATQLAETALPHIIPDDQPSAGASGRAGIHDGMPGILVTVDPGAAPAEAIADLLSDLSILYRRMGGSGINFTPQVTHVLAGGAL